MYIFTCWRNMKQHSQTQAAFQRLDQNTFFDPKAFCSNREKMGEWCGCHQHQIRTNKQSSLCACIYCVCVCASAPPTLHDLTRNSKPWTLIPRLDNAVSRLLVDEILVCKLAKSAALEEATNSWKTFCSRRGSASSVSRESSLRLENAPAKDGLTPAALAAACAIWSGVTWTEAHSNAYEMATRYSTRSMATWSAGAAPIPTTLSRTAGGSKLQTSLTSTTKSKEVMGTPAMPVHPSVQSAAVDQFKSILSNGQRGSYGKL